MKEKLTAALKASISEVLETMFFMSLEFSDEGKFEDLVKSAKGKILVCQLNFHGNFSGRFHFFIPEELLLSVTENFLGQERNSIDNSLLHGTLTEMINMIAGSTFSIYDDQAVFTPGIPEMVDIAGASNAGKEKGYEEIFLLIESIEGYFALKMVFGSPQFLPGGKGTK